MPRPTHDPCPQCGQPKLRGSKVCMACHYQRNVSSVGTLRVKRREAMVELMKVNNVQKMHTVAPKPTQKSAPVVTYEPVATSEQLVNVETGQPLRVKVGPSTVQFVQCPVRAEGQAHHYLLDQDNHGVCSCGAKRDWPRPTFDIGWGDDREIMAWG